MLSCPFVLCFKSFKLSSPSTFQEGLTAEETAKKEPDESERMQVAFFFSFTTNFNLFFYSQYAHMHHGVSLYADDRCSVLKML